MAAKGKSAGASVADYLDALPPPRRKELERVRAVVRKSLPAGYEEAMASGMIVYQVPLAVYPDTYNGHPLWYVALAAQKSYLSLHLLSVYSRAELMDKLRRGFQAAGKRLDMGKACLRFRAAEDLALDTIGKIVASTP